MISREKFKAEFAGLCEVFEREATTALIHAYYESLKDLTDDQMTQAVATVLKTRKYTKLPMPADIIEAITGDVQSAAIIALDKAEKAIERYGSYRSVQFDDPVIHMVISAMGGWYKFCCPAAYGDEQDWHWKQKEFKSIYAAFAHRPTAECPLVLYGICDTESTGPGRPPELIGDRKKIEQWTQAARSKSPSLEGQKMDVKQLTVLVGKKL